MRNSNWSRDDYHYENFVSLSYTTLARNSPIALAIAVVAFPDEQLVPHIICQAISKLRIRCTSQVDKAAYIGYFTK